MLREALGLWGWGGALIEVRDIGAVSRPDLGLGGGGGGERQATEERKA